jgi:hypothetical protein
VTAGNMLVLGTCCNNHSPRAHVHCPAPFVWPAAHGRLPLHVKSTGGILLQMHKDILSTISLLSVLLTKSWGLPAPHFDSERREFEMPWQCRTMCLPQGDSLRRVCCCDWVGGSDGRAVGRCGCGGGGSCGCGGGGSCGCGGGFCHCKPRPTVRRGGRPSMPAANIALSAMTAHAVSSLNVGHRRPLFPPGVDGIGPPLEPNSGGNRKIFQVGHVHPPTDSERLQTSVHIWASNVGMQFKAMPPYILRGLICQLTPRILVANVVSASVQARVKGE